MSTDPDAIRTAAHRSAKLGGCICRPDITITDEGGGLYFASVQHDGFCPLAPRPTASWN